MRTISLRTILLLGFVIAMPLLALPSVARRLDEWLYGPPPAEFSQPPLHRDLLPAIEPLAAERVSPATYDEVDPAALSHRRLNEGLDALSPSPPPLDPLPAFDRLATAAGTSGPPFGEAQLDAAATFQLNHIRRQLETLGAEYILLDAAEAGGSYRFHCQVRLDAKAPSTREFEAEAADPVVAAEKVLADVTSWQSAAHGNVGKILR